MYSPLQLRQYSLLELSLKEREASPNDVASHWLPGEPPVSVDFASSTEDEYQSRVILTIASKKMEPEDGTASWDFSIRIAGYFDFTDRAAPLAIAKKLSLVNGASMVYGLARDILHATSLRGQKPSIFLPSLNFQEFADRIASSDAESKPSRRKKLATPALVAQEPAPKVAGKSRAAAKGKR
jgi:preprotein translocase subunit SecB